VAVASCEERPRVAVVVVTRRVDGVVAGCLGADAEVDEAVQVVFGGEFDTEHG